MSQMFFWLLSKYGVGKFLSWGFLSYFLAHAREIFYGFKMNDDNFCSSCSHIFLTRVENRIIVYNLLGLLSHIFDRSEIVTAEHVLEMIDRSSFKILILENYHSLGKIFHRLIDFFLILKILFAQYNDVET